MPQPDPTPAPVVIVMQVMGRQADGKIHVLIGRDLDHFNVEDGDEFYTAAMAADPWVKGD